MQALEVIGDLGVELITVTMNYTAPAESIYNVIISKPQPTCWLATQSLCSFCAEVVVSICLAQISRASPDLRGFVVKASTQL